MPEPNISINDAGGTCRQHHPRFDRRRAPRRVQRGSLPITSPDLANRLADEGVPPSEIPAVAVQLRKIIPLLRQGGDRVYITIHPWLDELLARYGDKLVSLVMTTRGRVEA